MLARRGLTAVFLLLTAAAIFFTRAAYIRKTAGGEDFPDIRIYQVVGKLVLAGVNPYDFSDHIEKRRQLRLGMATGPTDFVAVDQGVWDQYVSANLPGSTLLYALFEWVAQGSRFVWRELFIAGDVAIFLGLWALMANLKGGVSDVRRQTAIFSLAVIYPILSMAWPFVSQDKQFQTALLLFGAALLLSPQRSAARDLFTGFVLSLGVVFKLFGIILFPLWLSKVRERPTSFTVWSLLGACAPLVLAYWAFGAGPVTAILHRGVHASTGFAASGSPWQLLPIASDTVLFTLRLITVLLCGWGVVFLFLKGRIDALNLSAGLGVVLGCLWLQSGSIDRMNIVIMFAIASLASLSTARFLCITLLMTAVATVSFGLKYPSGVDQRIDAIVVTLFILAYAATLLSLWFSSSARPASSGAVAKTL